MRQSIILLLAAFIAGCSSLNPVEPNDNSAREQLPLSGKLQADSEGNVGTFLNWGWYQLEIARDGSHGEIVPLRSASSSYTYGHHINALKLLEGSPCTDCVSISNVHLLPSGDVSMDVSITHPYDNPRYTGFDVRGIIMFPASQYVPDDDLREECGYPPYTGDLLHLFSSSEKGDAELVNREGWTKIWNPAPHKLFGMYTEWATGYPIFDYYHGKFASGENIGTLNPFIRFYSNENRHMFEVGETVTRTYIIKPPAKGPIEACYAVYAHWDEPDVLPVTDPAADFPLYANSSIPYELEFYQDGIIDPDAPPEVQAEHIHIHLKHWGVIPMDPDLWDWDLSQTDFIEWNLSVSLEPHPGGVPDDYYPGDFYAVGYYQLPDAFPGTWPIIYSMPIHDTQPPPHTLGTVGRDWWIMDIEFGALDDEW